MANDSVSPMPAAVWLLDAGKHMVYDGTISRNDFDGAYPDIAI